MGLSVVGETGQDLEIRVCHGPKDLCLCTALQTFIHQTFAFPFPFPSLWSTKPLPSTSFVFSWRCYWRWSYWPFRWVTQFSWVCLMYTYDSTWDVEFLAISIKKDVTAISSFDPPNAKFWALSVLRKENDACYLAVIKLQPLPAVSTKEKYRRPALDGWGASQGNDFSEPTLLHLLVQRNHYIP